MGSIIAFALATLYVAPGSEAPVWQKDYSVALKVGKETGKSADDDLPRTFGSINTYNVGMDPALVSAWTKTLSAGEKQEMVGRCAVIIQNQQNFYSETANFCQNFAIAIAENIGGNGHTGQ